MATSELQRLHNKSSRRFVLGMALAFFSGCFAFIPLLKLRGVVPPSQKFVQWLWEITPDISFHRIQSGAMSGGDMVAVVSFFVMIVSLFIMYFAHKKSELFEQFRKEAEKKFLVDDHVKHKK